MSSENRAANVVNLKSGTSNTFLRARLNGGGRNVHNPLFVSHSDRSILSAQGTVFYSK